MRRKIPLFILACLLACPVSFAGDDEFELYLVRHAEKEADGSRDPALTEAGQQRAVRLAAWLKNRNITRVWSSGYKRTVDTAQPLTSDLGLILSIYDPRNQSWLAEHLMERQDNALVVGHSNTIPELARLLCECEIADMDETEYDRLIVITVGGDGVQAETLDQGELFQQ